MRVLEKTVSILVNVFFKTTTLSAIFVHCLPRDGIFLKVKNLNFRNFFAQFHPHVFPRETPLIFPFKGLLRLRNFHSSSLTNSPTSTLSEDRFAPGVPGHFPLRPPHLRPFQGDSSREISGEKQGNTLEIQPILELISTILEQRPGLVWGRFGRNFGAASQGF